MFSLPSLVCLLVGLLTPARAAADPTSLWIDLDIREESTDRVTELQMPYAWLDEGVLSTRLQGQIESVAVDVRSMAAELEGQPAGARRELALLHPGERVVVAVERRAALTEGRARRLWFELQGFDERAPRSGAERSSFPLGLARLALRLAGGLAEIDQLEQVVAVDEALDEMAHEGPFTLLRYRGPEGELRVGTE